MFAKKLSIAAKGFCMGAADVVPGVSGGTMAFILGIYTQLIDAIKSFDKAWLSALLKLDIQTAFSKPHLGFLIPLGIGIVTALIFFTRVISLPELIMNQAEEVYSLFFGLIIGSVLVLYAQMQAVVWQNYVSLVIGLALGLFVFNLIPTDTPEASWFIFLSGALAICALVLPGISGSFILLMLNKYSYIFNAIGHFQWHILIPFALGGATGLILASRLLSYVLHHYYKNSLFFIIGLLLASLSVIWPYQNRSYVFINDQAKLIDTSMTYPTVINQEVMIQLLIAIIGFVAVVTLNTMQAQRQASNKM